jgi:hypothetical protein
MKGSVGFEKVVLASSDGIKLRVIASAGREFSAATLYMGDPGELYDSSEPVIGGKEYLVKGSSRIYH